MLGALALCIAVGAVIMRRQLIADPAVFTLTVRRLFTLPSLAILAAAYAVPLAYVFGLRRGEWREVGLLLLWYGCVVLTAGVWYTPVFVSGARRIAVLADGAYLSVGMEQQLAVLYGFSLLGEAAGFYLPVYLIFRLSRLLGDV